MFDKFNVVLFLNESDFSFKLLSIGSLYFLLFSMELYYYQKNLSTKYEYPKTRHYPEISTWGIQNMSKVVYSCVIGNKSQKLYPFNKQPGFDYILFSDVKYENTNWTVITIPEEIQKSSLIKEKKENFFKINPHLFFKEYDLSIYVDLDFKIIGDLNDFVFNAINPIDNIYILHHQYKRNVSIEFDMANKNPKPDSKTLLRRLRFKYYNKENFPDDLGFIDSGIIMRNHNKPDCIALMNKWWQQVFSYSYRDNLSFNYAMWKTGIKIKYMATYFAYDYFNRTTIENVNLEHAS